MSCGLRRVVGPRLPAGSSVVDVAWRPTSPLASFADRYPTFAVTPDDPEGGSGQPGAPAVRADVVHLPLADSSVDCVLLLDPVSGATGGRDDLIEVRRVLRSGGLAVVAGRSMAGRGEAGVVRVNSLRRVGAQAVAAMVDLGLMPEQVNYLLPPLHPLSVISRIRNRARSGRPPAAADKRGAKVTQLRRTQVSSVVVLGRKP